jgi:RNA polymerase sigma factor (sigma-70 family)
LLYRGPEGVLMMKTNELPMTSPTSPETLLLRFQNGEEGALDDLLACYLPRLQRWARDRFPSVCNDGMTTDDLVQEAFVRSLPGLRTFQPKGPGGLLRYLRTIVLNQIRDHARCTARRPRRDVVELDTHIHPGPSPLDEVLARELRDSYRHALAGLPEQEQRIVVAYVEQRCTDDELAELFDKPSRNAARMARGRAIARVVRAMSERYAPAGSMPMAIAV